MASPATTIRVVETIRVTPPPDSPESATEFTLPLTFFDTIWFKFHPVERVFFYQLNESTSTPSDFNSVILPKLKHSLSLTLLHYLPLAGNLRWPADSPKPIIIYTQNDGVSLTVAESNSNFTILACSEIHDHEALNEMNSLVPLLQISDDVESTIALQITLFPSQGFSIGISAHHAVLDGKSSTMFMKSWAHLCKHIGTNIENCSSSLPSELTPFYDRTVISDPTGLDVLFLNQWLDLITSLDTDPNSRGRSLMILQTIADVPDDLVRATFTLTREDINKLRRKAAKTTLHLSSFVVTFAYISTCLVRVKGGESEGSVNLGFTVDARCRLDPPIADTYFGNCVSMTITSAEAGKFMDETSGFAFATELVSDMVKQITETNGVLKGIKENQEVLLNMIKESGKQIMISVAGSPRLDVYGIDFGWGKPRKVEIVSVARGGAMALAESRDGSGGIEIGLTLDKLQMQSFASLFYNGLK